MKVGDLVRVKKQHWSNRGEVGVVVEALFPNSKTNNNKGYRILFPSGKVRPKLATQLELLNESG